MCFHQAYQLITNLSSWPVSGVESFDIDLKEQKVTVKGNVKPDAVLQTVSKTGKKTAFWEAEQETKEETSVPSVTATAWACYLMIQIQV